ncbi:hypothetical protein IB277_31150 [Ensifer sp. ENS07]|uniref:hypothetical protein n=1 Tax=Ensifer sp. ENS07 TaxID=2769274 RepID=UPI001782D05F|nr:hypothetical protein [Ensifer sp. ENS07]MBD9640757.1 hypothetical protein [Ensifer sp. ENS07]
MTKPEPSHADEPNRISDLWDDFVDALGELRRSCTPTNIAAATALYWRWSRAARKRK